MPGGESGKCVVAYNKLTGERVWSALDDKASYTSPMLVTLDGVDQVCWSSPPPMPPGSTRPRAPCSGRCPGPANTTPPARSRCSRRPNRFIVTSGYGGGSALMEAKRGAGGWEAKRLLSAT